MLRQERLLLGSLLLGFLYNILIYGENVGISFPLFIVGAMLLLLYILKSTNKLKKDYYWLFTVPIFLLSIRAVISDNYFFHFFNQKIIVLLFVAISLLLVGKDSYKIESFSFVFKIIETLILPLRYFTKPYTLICGKIRIGKKVQVNSQTKKVLAGLFISVPILIIITALLSSADMVFNEMIAYLPSKLTLILRSMNFLNNVDQLFVILLVATYTYAYSWNLLMPRIPITEENKNSEQIGMNNVTKQKNKLSVDGTVLITVLVMINTVYLVFSMIQFSYLFSGGYNILPGDFTYAEYARQGFFQLLLVTMLNFIFILSSLYFSKSSNKKIVRWVQKLLLLMGLFTYIMIYSSFYRMGLYSYNYGYTYLRIFVYFFLFLEVPLLGTTLVYIFKPSFNLIRIYIIAGLVFYIGLNYINVDNMIAKNNVDRYFETGNIDTNYLRSLSYDALPQLSRLLEAKDPNVRMLIKDHLIDKGYRLKAETSSWQEFNYSRYKAMQILREVQ